jgi:hypothetical protein
MAMECSFLGFVEFERREWKLAACSFADGVRVRGA